MTLDILDCFVKKQQQNNSPCTLNLTCTHPFHREMNPRDQYNNRGGQGPGHKSWRGFSLSSSLLHLLSFPSVMFSMAFLYHQSKLLPGNNKNKEEPENPTSDVLLPWILNRARDLDFNSLKWILHKI